MNSLPHLFLNLTHLREVCDPSRLRLEAPTLSPIKSLDLDAVSLRL